MMWSLLRCGVLACWVGACVAGMAVGEVMMHTRTQDEFSRQFTFPTGGWTAQADALVGESPTYHSLPRTARADFVDDAWTYFVVHPVDLWRYAIAGDAEWDNYTVTCTVRIEKPAPLEGFRVGESFFNYQWGREAIGSDAGIMVRYQGPDDYYMVRLSSAYQHVELWKTNGGVVRVVPFALDPAQAHQVAITVSGRWIVVSVNGTELIRYYDPIDPLRTGRVGLGVRESRVRFSDVRVQNAALDTRPAPVHTPDFKLRKWVGRDYIFDGDEPIAYVLYAQIGIELREVKLLPGLMPLLQPRVGVHCYVYRPGGDFAVVRDGETFAFTATLREKDDGFVSHANWELTYDPACGYVWDKRVSLEVLKNGVLREWLELDDPLFYQLVAPVTDKMVKGLRQPNYGFIEVTDGRTLAFPVATHLWIDGVGDARKAVVRPDGKVVTTIDGWGVVSEITADNAHAYYTTYCHWGLDLHIYPTSRHVPVQGDVFTGRLRYYLMDRGAVQDALARGVLPEANRENHAQRFKHVEPINNMRDIYPGMTGEAVRLWTGNYTVDRTVGRGDAFSMRINTADITNRLDRPYGDERPNIWLGPSYWTGPYLATRYRIGMWVKAEQFNGKVVLLANGFNHPAQRKIPDIAAELPIDGRCDWTYVSFEATFPREVYNWVLRIDPVGEGVVWIDDIDVTPLDE